MTKETLRLTKINQLTSLRKTIYRSPKLYLKSDLKFKYLGGSWEAIQFLCTWQRIHKKVFIELDKQLSLENINYRNELPLIAFFLSTEVLYQRIDERNKLLTKFIKFVETMNSPTLSEYLKNNRAREFKFICLGGAKNEYLRLFYRNKKFRTKNEIIAIFKSTFQSVNSPIKKKEYLIKNLSGIVEIIYEVLSNADKHGSRDIEHNKIPQSIRSIDINFVNFTATNKEAFLANHPHFLRFLSPVRQLLVISIFDNGEGIVKKYYETTNTESKKEADLTFEVRKDILKEVFNTGNTSSKIPGSGMGLVYVKDNIQKLKGAFFISTGSLLVNFYPKVDGKYSMQIKEVSYQVGTLFTVLIPLESIDDV